MKRQRGFGIWGYIGSAVAIVAVIAVTYWLGYGHGTDSERAKWTTRESEELRAANAEIDRLQREARVAEQAHAESLTAISANYQKELRDAKRAHDAHVAAVRAGSLRLRDPGASTRESACEDRVSEAAAGAGVRDGAEGAELSERASQFLLELTARADRVAEQLVACQAIVRRDRE